MARINSKALKPRLRKIRRVVTGHDREARSVIASDASSPHVMTLQGIPIFGVTEIWKTDSAPADNRATEDPCTLPVQLAPPKRGTVIRVVEFTPDRVWLKSADREKAFASMGRSGAQALAHDASASRHPMMHRTQSVDYAIVISGEIWALMDTGETKMKGRRYSHSAGYQSCLVKPFAQAVPCGFRTNRRKAPMMRRAVGTSARSSRRSSSRIAALLCSWTLKTTMFLST
jgi:hypothetical protein